MEFSTRGFQRNSNPRPAQDSSPITGGGTPAPQNPNGGNNKKLFSSQTFENMRSNKSIRILSIVLFVSLMILFVATVIGISTASTSKEFKLVNKDGYQVVALSNDGTFFFGKIVDMNSKNIILRDVFYLNNPSSENAAESTIQLVKRGCEVHRPEDQMVILREHVSFWENLRDEDAVNTISYSIKQWKEQNPDGQTCNNDSQVGAPVPTNPTEPTVEQSTQPADGETPPATNPTEPVAEETTPEPNPATE